MDQPLTPELLRTMAGVSRIPRPVDQAAFLAAIQCHAPSAEGDQGHSSGFVLLDVDVSATGEVEQVRAVPSPAGPVPQVVLAAHGAAGEPAHEPLEIGRADAGRALAAAAEAALREARFTPALRDGTAVPFTLRMSIRYGG